jgi:hypothetical protein
MDLLEILKQFKTIASDPVAREISKRAILATTPKQHFGFRRILAGVFETGVAVALSVFFIMVIAGQFSNLPVAPVQLSVINPDTLRAEAQAIDIQIELAKLSYEETTTTIASTVPMIATIKPKAVMTPLATKTKPTQTTVASSSSMEPTSTLSVDQALEQLSQ